MTSDDFKRLLKIVSGARWLSRATLPNIQRVTNIKALGITITSQLSMNLHVDTLVECCGKTLYGLRVLRAHGMSDDCTQEVFRSIVTAKLTYASQVWFGFCTASDINKLDRFLARCRRHNYCNQTIPSMAEQFDNADQSIFRTVLYKHNHVIHRLLPLKKRLQYKLRPCNHNLVLTCRTSYYDSCNFINRMIFSDAY